MKCKRSSVGFLAAALVAGSLVMFGAPGAARAQGGGGFGGSEGGDLPPDIMQMVERFNERLRHRFAPVIEDVSFGPASPGKPVDVTVVVGHDDARASDKATQAAVYYSADGGATMRGPVKLASKDGKRWSGQLPAPASAGSLLVMPWARDSFGNVAVDLVCPIKTWPPFEDPCSGPGAVDPDPFDDPSALIEDDYDIWEIRVGMDAKNIYLQQNVEGQVSQGTMTPPHINAYSAILIDPEELKEIDDIMAFFPMGEDKEAKRKRPESVFMLFYAPLAAAMGGESVKPCGLLGSMLGGKPPEAKKEGEKMDPGSFIDAKNATCKSDGTDLFLRLDRAATFKEGVSFVALGGLTGFVEGGGKNFIPSFRDLTAMTRATYRPHSVDVR